MKLPVLSQSINTAAGIYLQAIRQHLDSNQEQELKISFLSFPLRNDYQREAAKILKPIKGREGDAFRDSLHSIQQGWHSNYLNNTGWLSTETGGGRSIRVHKSGVGFSLQPVKSKTKADNLAKIQKAGKAFSISKKTKAAVPAKAKPVKVKKAAGAKTVKTKAKTKPAHLPKKKKRS